MSTAAETRPSPAPASPRPVAGRERRLAWAGLAVVLAVGLLLRLWGIREGLPFVYNADEADHFLTHALRMFSEGTLDPHYFANPPAYTYLLHGLFSIWFGGGDGALRAFARDPGELYTLARVTSALLGTLALWLLYLAGSRLLGRGPALLAAALEAVAFLPVFYSHLALNDVPTLAPLTLSLLGSAGILRRGRARDALLAGVGLGLACAAKYTAGIAVVPLLAAIVARQRHAGGSLRDALRQVALAGGAALAAFLVANPYSLLDFSAFRRELAHQSSLSAEAQGKLGAPRDGGLVYYLWSLGWGLGWAPAAAALGGAVVVWRRERALGWMLVPAPVLFLVFMGLQGRYFGRWLMPSLPFLCLLAAVFAAALTRAVAARGGIVAAPGGIVAARGGIVAARGGIVAARGGITAAPSPPRPRLVLAGGAIAAVLLAQGIVYSVHSGLVLSRPDTRAITRRWMLAHIPRGAKVVVEPVAPDDWVAEHPGAPACPGRRWCKYASLVSRITPAGALAAGSTGIVTLEDYERTLAPPLISYYERTGYCWIVSGSTQSGRARADPRAAPEALAYYGMLARRGRIVFVASPYGARRDAVPFNFDWSFDYYPLAYHRPGPQMTVYRLRGGRCA